MGKEQGQERAFVEHHLGLVFSQVLSSLVHLYFCLCCYFRWSEKGEQQNLTGKSERKVFSPLSAAPTHQLGSPAFASPVFHAAFYPDKRIQHIVEQSLSSPADLKRIHI